MVVRDDEQIADDSTDVLDNAANDSYVAPIQYDITSYGADYDVEGLVKRLQRQDVLIPPFQRNYVWNQQEASRFIESLLLGLPVPGIFLARERDSNKLLVIDGQQRLKTLQFFYEGFFSPKQDDDKKRVFKLTRVQPNFEGSTYETLSESDKIKLNDSLIHATIIRQDSPQDDDTSIYHIFDRLNSEGRRLTPQEIRTAIDHGSFIDVIQDLNCHKNWRSIFGPINPRLKDQEMIIRFLALYFDESNYERPMNEFLNRFTDRHRKPDAEFLSMCQSLFISTIDVIWQSIGARAFRLVRGINAAVFDSVMVGLARRLQEGVIDDIERVREAYDNLLADPEYVELVSQSTSDERNVASRLGKAIEQFSRV